ncbi:LLM class flavin-dependent oxidoreductase [Cumulibacter soli]|uniref:LLM class flavin-dependent oxidoreductase n=1 Tax=Cumulibacter soli TaxID=2546344 RepID=UPI001067CDC5|nr:LLM class flavin-dependent oxidoreductase [Cumulibacter soli]
MSHIPTDLSRTPLAIGIELNGAGVHPAAWTTRPARSFTEPRRFRELARGAENAGFTFVTFGERDALDPPTGPIGRLDSIELAAFVAASTRDIGLLAVAGVIHAEPFHLANQLASLDFAATGRAGWIVDPYDSAERARSYGVPQITDAHRRRAEASEVVAAVRRLWDTWEDGVLIADVESGHFLDPDRLHYADFDGEFFSVKGPAITPRPPQGHLPILAPATADAPIVDVILASASDLSQLRERIRAQRSQFAQPVRVIVELEVLLDSDSSSATERLQVLDREHTWDSSRLRYVGDANGLVSLLRDISPDADGVRLFGAVTDVDLWALVRSVLPRLRDRGLLALPSRNLRATFGLGAASNSLSNSRHPDHSAQPVPAGVSR